MPTIYSISHPSQPNVMYIGKTQSDLKWRLRQHIYSQKKTEISVWIKRLISENKEPKISPVEVCNQDVANKREMFWIRDFLENGFYLLNKNGNFNKTIGRHKKDKRIVYQFNLKGEFMVSHIGVAQASKETGVPIDTIYRQLNRTTLMSNKYVFHNDRELSKETIKAIKERWPVIIRDIPFKQTK